MLMLTMSVSIDACRQLYERVFNCARNREICLVVSPRAKRGAWYSRVCKYSIFHLNELARILDDARPSMY